LRFSTDGFSEQLRHSFHTLSPRPAPPHIEQDGQIGGGQEREQECVPHVHGFDCTMSWLIREVPSVMLA